MSTSIGRHLFVCATAILAACHGGGGGGGGGGGATYTVGGAVTGLAGSGLVLQNNGANNLAVASPGAFTFSASLASGSGYNVSVLTQPTNPSQTCTVAAGSGTVGSANVTAPQVSCVTNTFAVGGTVSGLDAVGLVLQNNAGNDLTVSANGAFSFSTSITSGAAYAVTVRTQPLPSSGPAQVCSVTNGSGTVASSAVTNVAVACVSRVFKFLYVSNRLSQDIMAYSINAATGALTAAPSGPLPMPGEQRSSFGEPSGKFLYFSNLGSNIQAPKIFGFSVNSTTGALTVLQGSPFDLAAPPPGPAQPDISDPTLHPSGAFNYLAIRGPAAKLYGTTINSLTGVLTPTASPPYDVGFESGWSMPFDATGKILFVATNSASNATGGEIRTYEFNAGVLSEIQRFPTLGNRPMLPFLTPGDDFVLVPNAGSSSLMVFAVEKIAGVPTGRLISAMPAPGSTYATGPAGSYPFTIFYNRRNDMVYVFNFGTSGPPPVTPPSIATARMDRSTGLLTFVGTSPVSTAGAFRFPVLHQSGKFMIQYNTSAGSFQTLALNPANGLPGVRPNVAAPSVTDYIFDASGKYLYVTDGLGAGSVSSYAVDPDTGDLTLRSKVAAGTSPSFISPFGLQ